MTTRVTIERIGDYEITKTTTTTIKKVVEDKKDTIPKVDSLPSSTCSTLQPCQNCGFTYYQCGRCGHALGLEALPKKTQEQDKPKDPIVYHEKVVQALEKYKAYPAVLQEHIIEIARKKYETTMETLGKYFIQTDAASQPLVDPLLQEKFEKLDPSVKEYMDAHVKLLHNLSFKYEKYIDIDWKKVGKKGLTIVPIGRDNLNNYTLNLPQQWSSGTSFNRFDNESEGNYMSNNTKYLRLPYLDEVIAYQVVKSDF